jgi:hypothetical protein
MYAYMRLPMAFSSFNIRYCHYYGTVKLRDVLMIQSVEIIE